MEAMAEWLSKAPASASSEMRDRISLLVVALKLCGGNFAMVMASFAEHLKRLGSIVRNCAVIYAQPH